MSTTTLPKAIETLPPEKQALIRLMAQWATSITKEKKAWVFAFDEGVYKGQTICKIFQSNLTPLGVLNMLDELNYPLFHSIVTRAQMPILALLQEYQQ